MITIDIELSEDLPEGQRHDYISEIFEQFPFGYVDSKISYKLDDPANMHLFIQLAQSEITIEQEKFLNKHDYIRFFHPREGTIESTPTLEPWEVETLREITENKPCIVPSNGQHTRFYTEPVHERQWQKLHHFIDVEGTQPMYGEVTITQFAEDSTATQVTLTHNELDDLLTVLLQRQLATAKESHENLMKMKRQEQPYIVQKNDDFLSDDSLDSLDDHPF